MKALLFYLRSWWLPSLIFCAVALVSIAALFIPAVRQGEVVGFILLGLMGLTLLGILAACVTCFIQRRWAGGVVNLLALPLLGGGALVAIIGVAFYTAFSGPSEDNFSANLNIPENLSVEDPLPPIEPGETLPTLDTFQLALLKTLDTPASGGAEVNLDLTELLDLSQNHRDLLIRYLSAHPAWRVYREDGKLHATRRWMVGTHWNYSLHGYYSRNDVQDWSEKEFFQTRLNLGLDGKTWAPARGQKTLKPGQKATLPLTIGNDSKESTAVIQAPGLTVEIFEQSKGDERRLTKATLDQLRAELAPLKAKPTWETAKSLLPQGSIDHGTPRFTLHNSRQGGIYDSQIWVNPGEPGELTFRAFEVTKGTRLSQGRLEEYSAERPGWSEDPAELFFCNTTFTIYEGDWDKFYAARFELWFKPDSGAPERKLLEKIYRIEGWQR